MSTLTNLIAYWRMDEASGSRLDSVGALRLEPSTTVHQTTGKLGDGAVEIQSGDGHLAANGTLPANFSANTLSIAGWLRIDTSSDSVKREILRLHVHNGSGGNVRELTLSFDGASSELELNTRDVDTNTDISVSASTFGALSDGTWYHVAVVWDSGTGKVRINNTEDTGSAKSMLGSHTIQSLAFGVLVGATFEFSVDDWGLWNEAISATDISDLYNSGSGAIPPGLGLPSGANEVAFFGFH